MEAIKSLQNPQVKAWASLLTKKGRDREGLFLVEGAHLVTEALKHDGDVTTVIFVPDSPAALEVERVAPKQRAPWVAVAEAVMEKITDARTPQGIAAVVRKLDVTTDQMFISAQAGTYIAIDSIQDPGNLGTVIRSADAVGALGVLIGHGTVDLYNPKTIRSTMGSLFHVPIAFCDLQETLPLAQTHGVRVISTSLAATKTCYEAVLDGAVCFLLGNEGAGVSPALEALANENVIIPMQGTAESLNVAMAATVLLYEAMRQREYTGICE
jgi:TrmH family RNA methyltransferase